MMDWSGFGFDVGGTPNFTDTLSDIEEIKKKMQAAMQSQAPTMGAPTGPGGAPNAPATGQMGAAGGGTMNPGMAAISGATNPTAGGPQDPSQQSPFQRAAAKGMTSMGQGIAKSMQDNSRPPQQPPMNPQGPNTQQGMAQMSAMGQQGMAAQHGRPASQQQGGPPPSPFQSTAPPVQQGDPRRDPRQLGYGGFWS